MIKIPNEIRTAFLTKFQASEQLEEQLDSVPSGGNNTKTVTIKVSFLNDLLDDVTSYSELRIRPVQIDPNKYDPIDYPEFVGKDEELLLVFTLVDSDRSPVSNHFDLQASLSSRKEISDTILGDFTARYEAANQTLDKMNDVLPAGETNTKGIFIPKAELEDFMDDMDEAAENASEDFDYILLELAQVDTDILTSTDPVLVAWVAANGAYTPRLKDDRLTCIYSGLDSAKEKIADTSYYDVSHLCPPNC